MKKYFAILLLFLHIQVYSQKAGLIVLVKPSGAILKIDGMTTKVGSLNYYEPSLKTIHVWYPKYKMLTDTVRIVNDKLKVIRERLKYSDEYLAYKKETGQQLRPLVGSVILTGLMVGIFETNRSRLKDAEQNVNDSYSFYNSSFASEDFVKYKSEYESSLDKYNNCRKLNNVLATVCYIVIPTAFAYSTFYYFKHHKHFVETPNPEFSFTPRLGIDNLGNVTTTLQLKF